MYTKRSTFVPILSLIFCALCWMACGPSLQYVNDISRYSGKIKKLEAKIADDPVNTEALCELGSIYLMARKLDTAQEYLLKAYKLYPDNAKTTLYCGMLLEFQLKTNLALQVYQKYTNFSRLSKFRGLMKGRYEVLVQEKVRKEMRNILAEEQKMGFSDNRMSSSTVAVFPLKYTGDNSRYAPMGRGLSEMLTTDLAVVPTLKLLERIRLQALFDELQLGQSKAVDATSSARMGRLLAAGKIISGSYTVSQQENLNANILSLDAQKSEVIANINETDLLKNFFKLEKDIVFAVIAKFNIILTQEQREKIQRIPTKNLQAFLAYCQGLEAQDRGAFKDAAKFYQKAAALDPSFDAAENKSQIAEGFDIANNQYILPTPDPISFTANDLVISRLEKISSSMNSNVIPGQDSRKVSEDPDILDELPEPPLVPPVVPSGTDQSIR